MKCRDIHVSKNESLFSNTTKVEVHANSISSMTVIVFWWIIPFQTIATMYAKKKIQLNSYRSTETREKKRKYKLVYVKIISICPTTKAWKIWQSQLFYILYMYGIKIKSRVIRKSWSPSRTESKRTRNNIFVHVKCTVWYK